MNRKNNLLSIGDLSKLTGAGIKSLRYYERINVLKPAYVSPETGYRYYTLDQAHLVEMIMFCIELDIPLVEMKKFFDEDGMMDFRKFFQEGRDVAEKKMKSLNKGLNLISRIERQMDLGDSHKTGEIYSAELPEKVFHVKPCGKSLKGVDQFDMIMSFYASLGDMTYPMDEYELPEYGILCEHSPAGAMYYYFKEVPKDFSTENKKTIPGGVYFCRQDDESKIETASEVFKAQLTGVTSFIAIETEIITGRHKVNKPVNELRVLLF